MTTRYAQFSGKFYPSSHIETRKLIEYIEKKEANNLRHIVDAKLNVFGGVVPHAGYMFSGYQAVHFFHYTIHQVFDSVVILSPSHRGLGPEVSIDGHDQWEIPGADFQTDKDLLNSGLFDVSSDAQYEEHAAEVMLPYLSHYRPDLNKIAVITIRNPKLQNIRNVAEKLYRYEKDSGQKLLVIASSDFNHFERAEKGREKDDYILEAIKNLDEAEVIERVRKYNVSVCGYGPISALMAYGKMKNEKVSFSILRRGHSGEILASDEVVDYVSLLCAAPLEVKP
ncbi:MAG TPA: AmmeMemoRadiSam system protein B [Salinivirga sp.]|uniref:AmmeMemoRadiSam system protein B n=1 Tax=Salinivirga sp. TaxID=1970192 RepID=UPI002B46C6D3|nr:AmmeMemoRadiSam system protein B [Salinivirga sp.]HKK58106.1 AmmeMemoRadiSam system protein B [Salinivirga sp.]